MNQIDQIRRAHASAKPKAANPAWLNCHLNCGVLLNEIEILGATLAEQLAERQNDAEEVVRLRETNKRLNRRCQAYESGLAERTTGGGSLGRSLANAEATRLRTALELAEEAALLLLRTGEVKQEYRDRALTMLDRARAGRSRFEHDGWWKCNKCDVLNHPTHHCGRCNAPPPSSVCQANESESQ